MRSYRRNWPPIGVMKNSLDSRPMTPWYLQRRITTAATANGKETRRSISPRDALTRTAKRFHPSNRSSYRPMQKTSSGSMRMTGTRACSSQCIERALGNRYDVLPVPKGEYGSVAPKSWRLNALEASREKENNALGAEKWFSSTTYGSISRAINF